MLSNALLHPDSPFPPPPALSYTIPLEVLEASDPGRSGGLVPSKGLEWSFILLAIGIVGLIFLLFQVMGTTSDVTPTYERESQIVPRELRPRVTPNQPDLGVPATGTNN